MTQDEMARELQDLRAEVKSLRDCVTLLDKDLIAVVQAHRELARGVIKLEREAEAKARTANLGGQHTVVLSPQRPLREPTYRTLGRKLPQAMPDYGD